ncbi:MAG TPA: UDP-N-acetylglucosamine 2-epimerase (non-hydrolyzing) [Fimbriimonadaceae bacterium]|jgi:UDP-GlcNAc3NAcA epimerase
MADVLTIVGARPQFIKASPVSRAFKAQGLSEAILHTGQHYDENMSDVFFEELNIPRPHYNLGIGSGHHGAQTGRMLEGIEEILLKTKPKMVLVYGDTNSTLAGALAAVKLHIPLAHVEAGLRSFNKKMPEEVNRILTDHAADLLFPPTETAYKHLLSEGVSKDIMFLTGDVMYDAALQFGEIAKQKSKILSDLGLERGGYVLATVHRAENTDDPARLKRILDALDEFGQNKKVVFPVHPRTRPSIPDAYNNLIYIDPVGYLDMVTLEGNAALIATDSGGVQKEAYFYQVPCVTLREETEWVELVESKWNHLAPPIPGSDILGQLRESMSGQRPPHGNLYGNGDAAVKIAKVIGDRVSKK